MPRRTEPWFKLYPRDYLDGTRELTLEQRGAYMDTICLQMVRGDHLPDDFTWLAHQMHCSPRKAKVIVESLIEAMKLKRGNHGIYNERAVFELESRASQSRANRESALKRYSKTHQKDKNHNENKDVPAEVVHKSGTTHARTDSDSDSELDIDKSISRSPGQMAKRTIDDWFEEFWNVCPPNRKQAKPKCRKWFEQILKGNHATSPKATADELIKGMAAYTVSVSGHDRQFVKLAGTWLNGGHWTDEIDSAPGSGPSASDGKIPERWFAGKTPSQLREFGDRWFDELFDQVPPNGTLIHSYHGEPLGHPRCFIPDDQIIKRGWKDLPRYWDSEESRKEFIAKHGGVA